MKVGAIGRCLRHAHQDTPTQNNTTAQPHRVLHCRELQHAHAEAVHVDLLVVLLVVDLGRHELRRALFFCGARGAGVCCVAKSVVSSACSKKPSSPPPSSSPCAAANQTHATLHHTLNTPNAPTTLRPRLHDASPKSAILTSPLAPLTSRLSHLRSLLCFECFCLCCV